MRMPLLYLLHSGQLFGTERMAVQTLAALTDSFEGIIIAPPGPVHAYAKQQGLRSETVDSARALLLLLWRTCRCNPEFALATTQLTQSLAVIAVSALYRNKLHHLHIVHGGTDERMSYGRKR